MSSCISDQGNEDSELNIGLVFVQSFRWLLLLLFAFLLEKAAEGITSRVSNDAVYSSGVVFTPMFGHTTSPLSMHWVPQWDYLIGFVQLLVTVIFAIRYLVCLVDPLESICRPTRLVLKLSNKNKLNDLPKKGKDVVIIANINDLLHFRIFDSKGKKTLDEGEQVLSKVKKEISQLRTKLDDLWNKSQLTPKEETDILRNVMSIPGLTRSIRIRLEDRLRSIHMGHIAIILIIAIPEFLLLFHAATSFQSFHQWLMFLSMLVLWDSAVFFFLLPRLVWLADHVPSLNLFDAWLISKMRNLLPGYQSRKPHAFEVKLVDAENVMNLPQTGEKVVIIARTNTVMHFRIFNGDGEIVLDKDDKDLSWFRDEIGQLRKDHGELWNQPILTADNKTDILDTIEPILYFAQQGTTDMAANLHHALGTYGIWNLLDGLVLVAALLSLRLHEHWIVLNSSPFHTLGISEGLSLLGFVFCVGWMLLKVCRSPEYGARSDSVPQGRPSSDFAKGLILCISGMLIWNYSNQSLFETEDTPYLDVLIVLLPAFILALLFYMEKRYSHVSLPARIDWAPYFCGWIIVLSSIVIATSRFNFVQYWKQPQHGMELVWACVILIGTANFSYRNYTSQRDVWHNHLKFLRADE